MTVNDGSLHLLDEGSAEEGNHAHFNSHGSVVEGMVIREAFVKRHLQPLWLFARDD